MTEISMNSKMSDQPAPEIQIINKAAKNIQNIVIIIMFIMWIASGTYYFLSLEP